jgi:hypothetical protein
LPAKKMYGVGADKTLSMPRSLTGIGDRDESYERPRCLELMT